MQRPAQPLAASPSAARTAVELAVLGPLQVTRGTERLEIPSGKLRVLLLYLAIHRGTPVSRDRLVEALWPARDPARGVATMRVHVSRLRDVLEPDRRDRPRILVTRGSTYLLDPDQVGLDTERVERLTTEGHAILRDDPRRAIDLLGEALACWRGRPLQDVEYEDFAQTTIDLLERRRLDAVLDRADALLAVGDAGAARDDVEPIAHDDPVAERPAELLVRALYQLGRQHDALRRVRRHERACIDLGLEPSPRFRALEHRILNHDPTLEPERTTVSSAAPPSSVRGYELRERHGAGPTGTVHRAFQRSIAREVAVKVVHPSIAADASFVRLFAEQVGRVAAQRHAHLVPILDAWRDPSGAYLVTPWFEGGSLAAPAVAPRRSSLPTLFAGLADALASLHEAGVVHGAVHPRNVLLDARGVAHLADVTLPATAPRAPPGSPFAADVRALGELLLACLAHAPADDRRAGDRSLLEAIAAAAASAGPGVAYPDAASLRDALRSVAEPARADPGRRSRPNPYKGLAAFTEADRLDLHGRAEDVADLVDSVRRRSFTALVGASGSGKSSVVSAGLLPQLRAGALPGSAAWSMVTMVPGADPFLTFEAALGAVAVSTPEIPAADGFGYDLAAALVTALPPDAGEAMIVVDQLEELFGPQVDAPVRRRFLDELVALAADANRRFRVVVCLRADATEQALTHPGLGDLLARGTLVLAPLGGGRLLDVIRGPAARVGVRVTHELVAELTREVAAAPAPLPLLQYVLTELFERRSTDELTLEGYRDLGRLEGVLERRAEDTFVQLRPGARELARRVFLRLVEIDDRGGVTRRRMSAAELMTLGARADVDAIVAAFGAARLLTHDRDPVSRTPTIEIAHEAVISAWPRLRSWIDAGRSDLVARRRLVTAAIVWSEAEEDPGSLLRGASLAGAIALRDEDTIGLDTTTARFVEASRDAAEAATRREAAARQERIRLERRARRRLRAGVASVVLAALIASIAAFAWSERDRAQALAMLRTDESLARELASASASHRSSSDPDLALLLAIEAADRSLAAGRALLPEVVDALHLALITPRPGLVFDGVATDVGGQVLAIDSAGRRIFVLASDRGVSVRSAVHGQEVGRLTSVEPPASGLDLHPDGRHVLTVHADGAREWDWLRGELTREFEHSPETTVARYGADGSLIAVGDVEGGLRVWRGTQLVADLRAHDGPIHGLDLDPSGTRVVTAGGDDDEADVLVWDLAAGEVLTRPNTDRLLMPAYQVTWHPTRDAIAVSTRQGEIYLLDALSGERLYTYGNGQVFARAVTFDRHGLHLTVAGDDGIARIYATWVGGEPVVEVPTGGVPLLDVASHPYEPTGLTVGRDGRVRLWRDLEGSELPVRWTDSLYPRIAASARGDRYVLAAHGGRHELPEGWVPTTEVIDVASGRTLLSRPSVVGWQTRHPAISNSGDLAAFAGRDGHVEIVDVESGAVTPVPDSAAWTAALAFSPDERLLAGAGDDGSITLWATSNGAVREVLEGHAPRTGDDRTWVFGTHAPVHDVTFTSDETLVSVGADGTVRRWRIGDAAGEVLHTFEHEAHTVAATSDGARIAAADITGAVIVVDAEGGDTRQLTPVDGRTELTFAPDGNSLAGAGPGGTTHLWDVVSARPIRRLHGAIYRPTSVAFVRDGRELRVAGGDGIIRGYLLDHTELVDLARSKVSRQLTPDECRQHLGVACPGVRGDSAA